MVVQEGKMVLVEKMVAEGKEEGDMVVVEKVVEKEEE